MIHISNFIERARSSLGTDIAITNKSYLDASKKRIKRPTAQIRVWTGGQWVQWETRPLHVQGHPLHLRKFRLHFIFCFFWEYFGLKIWKVFFKTGGEIYLWEKCWIPWILWFYFTFHDISSKKIFFEFFSQPTDRKILQINYVNSWFLTISQK